MLAVPVILYASKRMRMCDGLLPQYNAKGQQANLVRADRIYTLVLAFLAVFYSAQVFTPLRLHPDAVILLSIADSAAHNDGFLFHGTTTIFPPGYPALLASLLLMGVAHAWTIVAINFGFLFLGLFAVCYVLSLTFFREHHHILGVCVVSLLSFVFIRFFAIPLSDVPFFGLAMCSLAAMEHTRRLRIGRRFWLWLLATCILLLISIAVRRVGVALIPAFLWMVVSHSTVNPYVKTIASRIAAGSAIGVLACGAILALGWWVVDLNLWLSDFKFAIRGHTLTYVASSILGFRLRELGEITANVPFIVVPQFAQPALPWAGALALAGVVGGLYLKRKAFGPTEAFVSSYLAILIAWPYYDPRFWLPLIPLLISYCTLIAMRVMTRHSRLATGLLSVYLAVYALMGMGWLASSTMITFSRPAFLATYVAEGKYGPAYCIVLGPCSNRVDTREVDPRLVHLLRLYK
jgi:hypothetical protein